MSGGNTSTITVDDQAGGLYWTGGWTKCDVAHQENGSSVVMTQFSNSTYSFTTTANDSMRISWLGAGLIAYGTKSTDGSWYSWSVDGGQWTYEESWAASFSPKEKLVNLPQMTYGTHELILRNSRDVNLGVIGREGRIRLSVDYFELNGQQLKYDNVDPVPDGPSTATQFGASIGPPFTSATITSPTSSSSTMTSSISTSYTTSTSLSSGIGVEGISKVAGGGYQTELQGGIKTGLTPNFQIPTDIAKYANANDVTSAASSSFHTSSVTPWAFVGLLWFFSRAGIRL